MKSVLMVAYHFPPLSGSSGIQRTLRFAQQLPEFGWNPIVLTAHSRAYERTSEDLLGDVPAGATVERVFALDTARHLSLWGRYPGFLARPDRWLTWKLGAVPAGLRLIRQQRPSAIWSTFPIATAHVIGEALASRSGLPWIADFRDPMAQPGYPTDPSTWRSFKKIEERSVLKARFSVFTTPGAAREYRRRYPASAHRIVVVENGYDEESFAGLAQEVSPVTRVDRDPIILLHSGVVYPSERDPTQLFAAIGRMAVGQRLRRGELLIRFRASGHDELLHDLARRHGVGSFVETLPPIPYRAALVEMQVADGLLILQAANCNEQIPAKLYEYLRAHRPIVALTDPAGDTAGVVRDAGLETIARLDSPDEIAALLGNFIESVRAKRARLPDEGYVAGASRRGRTRRLAELLDEATTLR